MKERDKLVEFTNMDPWGWKQSWTHLNNHILHYKITYRTNNRRLPRRSNGLALFIFTLSWQHYVAYNVNCIPTIVDKLCHVGSTFEDSNGTGIRSRKNPHVFHITTTHTILPQVNIIIINYMNNAQTHAIQFTTSYIKPDHNKSNLL